MMNQAPKNLLVTLQLGNYPTSVELRHALLQWVYATRDFAPAHPLPQTVASSTFGTPNTNTSAQGPAPME
eukprot:5046387-Prorocentrum_lima.AAC.1